jgi:hypothetical protein
MGVSTGTSYGQATSLLLACACGSGVAEPPRPTGSTRLFEDASARAFGARNERARGVAVADYDGDGWEDIYWSTPDGDNLLHRNVGDGTFEEVAARAGVTGAFDTRSAVWGDFDNDGHIDLYLAVFEETDILYRNRGDGTFVDVSTRAGIENVGRPFSVSLGDVDGDGWLDIYVANFGSANVLYHNDGGGRFSNVLPDEQSLSEHHAMGTIFFDYDDDGDPDLFTTHDGQRNVLFENAGGLTLVDVSAQSGLDFLGFGMGVDVADVDADGHLDVYVTHMNENELFVSRGDGTFTNAAHAVGAGDPGMGWGTSFIDFDNDGQVDIYVANDSDFSFHPNVLLRNEAGSFVPKGADESLASQRGSYGTATGDFDRDGRLDLAVANLSPGDRCQLFMNGASPSGRWIGFELEGAESNRSAIGARVEGVDDLGVLHVDEITAGSGFAGASRLAVHFGLGSATELTEVVIRWPSGRVQSIASLRGGTQYFVREGAAPEPSRP